MKLGQNEPFLLSILWILPSLMYHTAILKLKFFSICASPEDDLTELVQMFNFWFQFRLKLPLMFIVVSILSKNIVGVRLWV